MLKLIELLAVLERFAPLELSQKMIEKGCYDNSGIIVDNGKSVKKILFSLDLSDKSLEKALELDCDTIVTHHPAIYNPIKNLSVNGCNAPLLGAIKNGLNVISMHLNLDIADGGIDSSLALALGGDNARVLDFVDHTHGYGREFLVDQSFEQFVSKVKQNLGTERIITYGEGQCKIVASFCGSGASEALSAVRLGASNADTVVSSDMAHHEIKELIEMGKKVVIIPHYSAEDYGFNRFYQSVSAILEGASAFYFQDKRFI